MGRLYQEFRAANCEILLLLGEPVEKARSYTESLHLPFPVLADPERNVYHRYGLEKMMVFIQRTASVVVDREGLIRYMKATSNAMTWLQESRAVLGFVKSMEEGAG